MRGKEKEITARSEIEDVIHRSIVCRIGMSDDDMPYVVPLCFGYQDNAIYVHGSLKGKKAEILRKNPNVCFEFDIDAEIVEAETACEWGMRYQSVIGFGRASFLEESDEKRRALDVIMNQYSDRPFRFPDEAINGTAVIRIEIASMTGKRAGFR